MSTVVNGWEAFFTAEVGASAALTGLVFVGISINLTKIMASPSLITRALQTMATLLSVLVVCSLLLVPGEAATALAVQVLFVGLAAWVTVVWLQIYQWRTLNPAFRRLFAVHISPPSSPRSRSSSPASYSGTAARRVSTGSFRALSSVSSTRVITLGFC